MAVMTPFFDIVAGVAILAGRSSLLDAKVFQAANTNITLRQLLALGFIGYGGWNLWKVEKAQDKLKESLEAEGVSNLLPVGTKVRSYDFWPYNKDTYIEGVIEKIAPSPRCSPNCMHYHIRRTKSVRDGVEDREDLIGTMFMTHPYEDGWDADYEGQLAKHIIPFKSGEVSEVQGAESFAAMTKANVLKRAAIKQKYREEFKNWVKKPYPYEVRVTQDTKGDWCESCGDISARPEGEGVHYQFVLPRQNSWRVRHRQVEGDYCRGCGSDMCQRCVDGDNYCDSCGELLCNSCRQDYETYGGDCPEIHYQAESFNAAYLQDPASEYGGPTEMILDTCPVCAEFSNDMTPKELWPRWGVQGSMEYMCDDCWNAMETDPYAQWIYTQEAESEDKGEWRYMGCLGKPYEHSVNHDDWEKVKHLDNLHDWIGGSHWEDEHTFTEDFEYCANCGQYYSPETGIVSDETYQNLRHGAAWWAESFSAEGIDGSRAKSEDYWLYHGHNSDGSWCGQKLWVSKGYGYAYLCSCNATLYRDDAVLSAKNPKKLPEPKDPKTTPYGTIFIHEFMSEAESFSAEEWWEEYRDDLEAVDLGTLDWIEQRGFYRSQINNIPKAKALQVLINNVEFDDTQLSPQLAKIARMQTNRNYGAESFSAESRDELIDTLIGIRQELAREEGMEDWENESEGSLDSLSSAFIQELIWYMDGDRDTWDAESLTSPRPPRNSIEWGIYDNPSELMRLVSTVGFNDDYDLMDMPTGALSQMQPTPHPDGAVFPCSMCDEIEGTPEYCAGVKWQLDEGLAGLQTTCDEQLQRSIHERTKELHSDIEEAKSGKSLFTSPLDSVEWISRIEPAHWPYVERIYGYKNAGAESFSADTFTPAELVFGEDVVVVDDDTGYRCPFEVEELSDEGLFTYTVCNHPLELVYHVADGLTSDEPFYTYECSECHEGFQAIYTVCTRNGEKISEDWEVGENLYGWAAEKETYNAEQDSYGECGCGDHEITDDDYDACETCGTIWEFPDCTSGLCGICFKVCEKCNPKKRKKHYQTCTLEG